jgi:hypothetical protein
MRLPKNRTHANLKSIASDFKYANRHKSHKFSHRLNVLLDLVLSRRNTIKIQFNKWFVVSVIVIFSLMVLSKLIELWIKFTT